VNLTRNARKFRDKDEEHASVFRKSFGIFEFAAVGTSDAEAWMWGQILIDT